MRRRIYGIETEFGITAVSKAGRALSAEEAARALFASITSRHKASSIFLTNGSRLYLDVGSHPEYATAECDSLEQLLTHDRAGEELLSELAAQASVDLRDGEGLPIEVVLFKNNTDSHGNSYGTHENYLVARQDDFGSFTEALLPFLVTRQLTCGAGKVLINQGRPSYLLSQRADHMRGEAVSSATTRTRPMINTRDEPHANPQKYRRMHVIVGDANMCEASTLVKLASMELVLRVLEEGDPAQFTDWLVADPVTAIRAAATARDGSALIQRRQGEPVPAWAVQQAYWEATAEFVDHPWLARAHDLWGRIIDALSAGQWRRLAGEVDWAIKLTWLERMAERYGCGLGDPRIQRLDLAYHDIRAQGLLRMLETKQQVARYTDPAAVELAQHRAPETTRAHLRGAVVAAGERARRRVSVDWTKFEAPDIEGSTVLCHDPFACEDPRVDMLVERILTAPLGRTGFNFADPMPI